MVTQVFQVKGISDSHPDYSEWTVAAYANPALAQQHAKFLNEFLDTIKEMDARNGNCELECALRDHHPLDDKYTDNGGVVYKVEPLDVSLMPFLPTATLSVFADQVAKAVAEKAPPA